MVENVKTKNLDVKTISQILESIYLGKYILDFTYSFAITDLTFDMNL